MFMLGDLNGDGKIDVLDLFLTKQAYYFEDFELTENEKKRVDFNKDGKVSVADIVQYQYLRMLGLQFFEVVE